MKVTIEGYDHLFDSIDDAFEAYPKRVIAATTQAVFDQALKNIKPHTKTGRLENNLDLRVRGEVGEVYILDNGMKVDYRGGTNYALFVHFGTKPHVIRASKRKSLRWAGPNGFAFAKEVRHPGYKGDPFMYNAMDEVFKNLDKIFDNEWKQ